MPIFPIRTACCDIDAAHFPGSGTASVVLLDGFSQSAHVTIPAIAKNTRMPTTIQIFTLVVRLLKSTGGRGSSLSSPITSRGFSCQNQTRPSTRWNVQPSANESPHDRNRPIPCSALSPMAMTPRDE